MPPATLASLGGEGQQFLPLGRVGDTVESQQIFGICLPDRAAAKLDAADLGLCRPDGASGLGWCDASRLAQVAQPRTEQQPQDGGPQRLIRHVSSLPRLNRLPISLIVVKGLRTCVTKLHQSR